MLDPETDWSRIDKVKFAFWGSIFTVAVDLVIYPMEVLKTRVQVDSRTQATVFAATFTALRTSLATEGLRGLFRGFGLYTFGGLPSQGVYFMGDRKSVV